MRAYFLNAGWMLIEKILRISVNFIFVGLIAKSLGPEEFGVISLAQSIVVMMLSVTNLGLDGILVNEFISKKEQVNKYFSTAIIARFLISALFVFLSILIISLMPDEDYSGSYKAIFIVTFISLIFYIQSVYVSYFQAVSKSKIITKISVISLVLISLIKAYLIFINATALTFAIIFSLDLLLTLIFTWFGTLKSAELKFSITAFDFDLLKDLLKQSWPLIISAFLIVIYSRLDQFMIANMLGVHDVGLYSVAIRISDAYIFIPSLIASSFYPMISSERSVNNFQAYFSLVFSSALFCGLIVIILSPFVVPVLFGASYIESITVINVTVFSSMFAVFGSAATNYLIIHRLGYIRLYRVAVGLIVNFILNIIWIPKYGIVGAAVATLLTQVFSAWLSNALSSKSRQCFWWQTRTVFTLGLYGLFEIFQQLRSQK